MKKMEKLDRKATKSAFVIPAFPLLLRPTRCSSAVDPGKTLHLSPVVHDEEQRRYTGTLYTLALVLFWFIYFILQTPPHQVRSFEPRKNESMIVIINHLMALFDMQNHFNQWQMLKVFSVITPSKCYVPKPCLCNVNMTLIQILLNSAFQQKTDSVVGSHDAFKLNQCDTQEKEKVNFFKESY